MVLDDLLISQFAKITKSDKQPKSDTIVYGTIVEQGGSTYMKIDGSDLLTPISTMTMVGDGDRVSAVIKNHSLTVTGNASYPSTRLPDVGNSVNTAIGEFNKVITEELTADRARIETLEAGNAAIDGKLTAAEADIKNLKAENVTITGKLEANDAVIGNLETDNIKINETLEAHKATIDDLDVKKLSVDDADIKYANIDFTNIGKAAMEYFYANSGLIENVVVGDASITGNLVGVTIKGDLIEGNTVVADKLVIKGENGLYYKLNTDGITTEAEQTEYNSINGSIITANSITATKINVDDLVAFDATIGGFNITDNSLYSGVKESINNTTRGIYMDSTGQIAFGDSNNFIKFYKDTDGTYKLAISASVITFGADGTSLKDGLEELIDGITTNLRIESSRGTVFKNNSISTVLSAVIYRGPQRITNIQDLHDAMGSSAYLQWKWQKIDEETFGVISASDSRISNDGFTLTISPNDVDTKVTFMCELIV